MRGKLVGTVLGVTAAVAGAFGLGYNLGSDRRADEFALVERQLGEARDDVERLSGERRELLAYIEECRPSEVQAAPEPAGGGAQGGPVVPVPRNAELTRGVPTKIDDTGYIVEFADLRRAPGGGTVATIAVSFGGRREERAIATGETATVNGVAVTVTGADAAKARLVLTPP